ncbi:hypothetical protein TREES_T100000939 [Tupaia chinensis]|uniref:Uncharacterized protein n=1 Tax=Tupaia chinensis TaxID=246437 RepID=L9JCW0_TUPCH|nr:hypothetical protein TREES_T100000939 [Tupaia chinensis]
MQLGSSSTLDPRAEGRAGLGIATVGSGSNQELVLALTPELKPCQWQLARPHARGEHALPSLTPSMPIGEGSCSQGSSSHWSLKGFGLERSPTCTAPGSCCLDGLPHLPQGGCLSDFERCPVPQGQGQGPIVFMATSHEHHGACMLICTAFLVGYGMEERWNGNAAVLKIVVNKAALPRRVHQPRGIAQRLPPKASASLHGASSGLTSHTSRGHGVERRALFLTEFLTGDS